MKKKLRIAVAPLLVLAAFVAAFLVYTGQYYHAQQDAIDCIESENSDVAIERDHDDCYVFAPEEPVAGLILYQGAKVQQEAYAPLMEACARRGILGVLVKMPYNLAVLDMNAAKGIADEHPEIEHWYIGGHSLGGAMAANYAEAHDDEFDGLILLAAFSTKDLTDKDVRVLSLYGSEDGVLNMESYEKYRPMLPEDAREIVIEGGNHAGFADYGEQKGDGTAAISSREQVERTADAIAEFIKEDLKRG